MKSGAAVSQSLCSLSGGGGGGGGGGAGNETKSVGRPGNETKH